MASFIAKAVVAPGGGDAVPITYTDPTTLRSYSCSSGQPEPALHGRPRLQRLLQAHPLPLGEGDRGRLHGDDVLPRLAPSPATPWPSSSPTGSGCSSTGPSGRHLRRMSSSAAASPMNAPILLLAPGAVLALAALGAQAPPLGRRVSGQHVHDRRRSPIPPSPSRRRRQLRRRLDDSGRGRLRLRRLRPALRPRGHQGRRRVSGQHATRPASQRRPSARRRRHVAACSSSSGRAARAGPTTTSSASASTRPGAPVGVRVPGQHVHRDRLPAAGDVAVDRGRQLRRRLDGSGRRSTATTSSGSASTSAGAKIGSEFLGQHLYDRQRRSTPPIALDRRRRLRRRLDVARTRTDRRHGVFGQRFDALRDQGRRRSSRSTRTRRATRASPRVAVDRGGNFVVVWAARLRTAITACSDSASTPSGAQVGSEFQVNTSTTRQYSGSPRSRSTPRRLRRRDLEGRRARTDRLRHLRPAVRPRRTAPSATEFPINSYTTGVQGAPRRRRRPGAASS